MRVPFDPAELLRGHTAAVDRVRRRGKSPITKLLPRPARLTLGGRSVRVGELRLIDLAELQQWLADQIDHPLASVLPSSAREDWIGAWPAAKAFPPRLGTAEAANLHAFSGYLVEMLRLCLARGGDDTPAESLLEKMTAHDLAALQRVAYGTDPWREVLDKLDPEPDSPPPIDWARAILELLDSHPSWTFADVGELTISQWRGLRCGPEVFTYQCRPRRGETLRDAAEREKRTFELKNNG